MKRKLIALMCVIVLGISGCGIDSVMSVIKGNDTTNQANEENDAQSVSLEVVTTFAGSDGNAQNYEKFCRMWQKQTGNTIIDRSVISDETFKMRVIGDFATGSEPDVLFFFIGADADSFVEADKVVSLDEIWEEYPDFAANLDVKKIPTSMVDGKIYAIPVNGYWEAMFVNTTVLKAAGVEMPGRDYTWEQFLADCEQIKNAGYTPIATALGNIPHYLWEAAVFNHTTPETHVTIPASVDEEIGQGWVAAMEDIKFLYESGYFPDDTNSATDDETFSMFMNGEAAFLIDGSWKVGSIVQNCQTDPFDPDTLDEEKLNQFSVTFVPGTDTRKATDMIGGMSMGYYITRSAWEDPAVRDAAVSFVSYMTSDDVVSYFAQYTANVSRDTAAIDTEKFNSLQLKALDLLSQCTSFTWAVQDIFQRDFREAIFDDMPQIVTGQISVEDAVREDLEVYLDNHQTE